MKIEELKNLLIEAEPMDMEASEPYFDAISQQGIRGWVDSKILDGDNIITLHFIIQNYITRNNISFLEKQAAWDAFWNITKFHYETN